MTQIPADIWIHVAQFIPSSALRALLEVNRTFFQLAMNERYRAVYFNIRVDTVELKRICGLRDSDRARRVRKLGVDMRRIYEETDHEANESEFRSTPSLDEIIQALMDTVICFTNIVDFTIQWEEISYPAEKLSPFLTAAWKAFGSSVRQVTFFVSLTYLRALLSTADGLMALKTLYLGLIIEENVAETDEVQAVDVMLADLLAHFVNKVAPTLRSLSFFSRTHDLTLSPLFRQLRFIPNLEQLSITVDSSLSVLSDPLGFTRFLHDHAETLSYLQWWSFPVDNSGTWDEDDRYKYQRIMDWLNENKDDMVLLSNLQTLRIPAPLRPVPFGLIVQYIRRSADTLTSLSLENCRLKYDEVDALVSIFATHQTGRLRELRLRVECLSPELVQLLARTLSSLETLYIDTLCVVGQNEAEERQPTTREQELLYARKFANNMRLCDFSDWPLHCISIVSSEYFSLSIGWKTMWLFAECVPSVKKLGMMEKTSCVKPESDVL